MRRFRSQTTHAFAARLALALFAALLLPLTASAAEAAAGTTGAEAGSAAATPTAPLSCEQIRAKGTPHAATDENVSEVIFHHVTDAYTVAFESPVSHAELAFNFKDLECRLLGWNGVVSLGGLDIDLTPTKHTFWLWVGALLVVLLFLVGRPPKKKGDYVPRGLYGALEFLVLFVRDDIARQTIPDREAADRYTPYLLTAFFFILVMNLLGLIPFCASATSNVSVTLALALFTFLLTQAATMRATGFAGYFKHLTGGVHWALWIIMIPVEFLGLFTKPFALTIRLFANMVAGHIIIFFLLGLIFLLHTLIVAPVSVAFAGAIYLLEIFVACLQAFIFTMLSGLFIGLGVAAGQHGHGEAEGGEH